MKILAAIFLLSPNPLLIAGFALLVIFRLLDCFPDHTQGIFQELGGFLAIRSLESHSVNLDFPVEAMMISFVLFICPPQ